MKSQTYRYFWTVLLTGVLMAGAACTKALGDNEITSQVQSKFSQDSGLQGKQLTVETSGGIVTLSGTVDNDAQRTAASRYASAVPGIKQIVNNLQVGSAAPAAVPPSAPDQAEQTPPAPPHKAARAPKPTATRRSTRAKDRVEMAQAAPPQEPESPAQATPSAPPDAAPATPPPPPTPPAPKKVTIPTGTTLAVRLVDAIDSEKSQQGETFRATLDSPLSVEGDVAIPTGYDVQGHVVDVKSAGKFAGKSELVLQLDRITVGSKSYNLQTDQYKREGSSRGKNTAEKVGAGAAIGAIIGGIAGGGKGAGIGAAAGGGLGGGVQAATKGQQIKLPTETVINFTLQSPLTVTVAESPNANRHKLDNPQ